MTNNSSFNEADKGYAPNARVKDDEGNVIKYSRVLGDHLKLRWAARRNPEKHWIEFSPFDLYVELNGVPLTTCQAVSVGFKRAEGFPLATLSFTLESLDIDVDTLVALQAFVEQNS